MTRCIGLLVAVALSAGPSMAAAQCCGDCNADGTVRIDELVRAVTLALDGCPSTPAPRIVLTGVRLSIFTATLGADVRQGDVALTLETDWRGNDGSDRAFVTISQPSTWPNHVELVKNGDFLRWIVTESSGLERDLSVRIDTWLPGMHTVKVSWKSGSTAIAIDGVQQGQETLGDLVLAAGSDFVLGPPPGSNYMSGPGTTFREVIFTTESPGP